MPPFYSSKEVAKTLLKKGFFFVSQRGSHMKYRKIGQPTLTVIIPAKRKEIAHGTFRSILRQSKLDLKDFE